MKKLGLLLITILVVFSCKKEERTDYVINGLAKDVYNGIRLYLNDIDTRGRLVPIDTAVVVNETFTFSGKVKNPGLLYLTGNSINGRFPIFMENSEMTLNLDKKNINQSTLTGSESHTLYLNYLNDFKVIQNDLLKLNNLKRRAQINKDSSAIREHTNALEDKRAEFLEIPYRFMEAYPKSFVSVEILSNQMKSRDADFERLDKIYKNLSPEVTANQKAKAIEEDLKRYRREFEANKKLQIGAVAPQFSGPNPEGDIINLSDVIANGNVTIIDFWAAWCGPCRRENPNVVRIYEKYHSQGLNIIGVSLDGQSRQKDPKAAWIQAIEEDQLTWNHVSNLNYFNDPIAQLYNIKAIPATFILDAEGKIVAKNLRGQALELKVKELLKQQP